MKNLFEKEELENKKEFDSRITSVPVTPGQTAMRGLFEAKMEKTAKTPDGKAMRAVFDDELIKDEKERVIPQQPVTPGVKAMKSMFDPEEVDDQKEFDGRNTFCPKTPDTKVIFLVIFCGQNFQSPILPSKIFFSNVKEF